VLFSVISPFKLNVSAFILIFNAFITLLKTAGETSFRHSGKKYGVIPAKLSSNQIK
jgi:hypothetical protein